MISKKNTILGKVKVLFCFLCLCINISCLSADETNFEGTEIEIKILDKVSSKNYKVKISIGEEKVFQNLLINVLKCQNSKFDDSPEITAYMQVTDLKSTNNNKVYIFNGWTFASSPSIRPFDHPVYDIWLKRCYN